MQLRISVFLALFIALSVLMGTVVSEEVKSNIGPEQDAYESTVASAIQYLRTKGQSSDGSFSSQAGSGVTALVTTALLKNGVSAHDPTIRRALHYLKSVVRPTGGIHVQQSMYKNYETCLGVMCFNAANTEGQYDEILKKADAFLKQMQWDEDEGHERDSFFHGGGGYGRHRRPDLSNTSFLIEALRSCGNSENDPAIKKALIFVSRCQNLESPHNTTPFSSRVNDGGFYYTGAAGGYGPSTENGGLRSYGSMTYAGLKSMIYAGVTEDDPRVRAAVDWIRKHYGLSSNPGMQDAGLFYYYHTFAKTLDALGQDYIEDGTGTRHDWRRELAEELARRQQRDGSWVNENSRWLEGDANLVTAYALLALSYCRTPR